MNSGRVRFPGFALFAALAVALCGCAKQEPPPDPLKGPRAVIEKAKGLDDVVGKAADEARKKIDDEETK